jgi:hypothetical protein
MPGIHALLAKTHRPRIRGPGRAAALAGRASQARRGAARNRHQPLALRRAPPRPGEPHDALAVSSPAVRASPAPARTASPRARAASASARLWPRGSASRQPPAHPSPLTSAPSSSQDDRAAALRSPSHGSACVRCAARRARWRALSRRPPARRQSRRDVGALARRLSATCRRRAMRRNQTKARISIALCLGSRRGTCALAQCIPEARQMYGRVESCGARGGVSHGNGPDAAISGRT